MHKSIFKENWFQPHSHWVNDEVASTFKALYKIRETFNAEIMSDEPILYDVAISSTGELQQLLKVNDKHCLKGYLLRQKDGLYMLVVLASPRWRWYPGKYLLIPYNFRFCMQPANIRQDTSAIWEKLIKPTYRAHLFDEVSTPLIVPK